MTFDSMDSGGAEGIEFSETAEIECLSLSLNSLTPSMDEDKSSVASYATTNSSSVDDESSQPVRNEAIMTTEEPASSPSRDNVGASETKLQVDDDDDDDDDTVIITTPVSSPSRGDSCGSEVDVRLSADSTLDCIDNEISAQVSCVRREEDGSVSVQSSSSPLRDGPSVAGLDDDDDDDDDDVPIGNSSDSTSESLSIGRASKSLEDSLLVSFIDDATADNVDCEIEVCRRSPTGDNDGDCESALNLNTNTDNHQRGGETDNDDTDGVGRASASPNSRVSFSKHKRSASSGGSPRRGIANSSIIGDKVKESGTFSKHRRSVSTGGRPRPGNANASANGGDAYHNGSFSRHRWSTSVAGEGKTSRDGVVALPPREDEKKEMSPEISPEQRKAIFSEQKVDDQPEIEIDPRYASGIKFTESDVCSVDGLPSSLQSQLQEETEEDARDKILQRLDGFEASPHRQTPKRKSEDEQDEQIEKQKQNVKAKGTETDLPNAFIEAANSALNYFLGIGAETCQQQDAEGRHRGRWDSQDSRFARWENTDEGFAILGCAPVLRQSEERVPAMATSLIRVTSEPPAPSYAETIRATEVDPRMKSWVDNQFSTHEKPPKDGSYHLGKSRTVIVHEIVRRSWTWCTAWSPNGDLLAVGTENHHLAVIDTKSSPVWRVRHDNKIKGPVKNGTTHSIRSIAWGPQFIAIGGTGNAVSILLPVEPYPVLHTIKKTGFVGSLSWKLGSNVLVIGSRLEKAMIVRINSSDSGTPGGLPNVESEVLYEIECKNWVNCVAFSPGGTWLAVGDAGGTLGVYSFVDEPGIPVEVSAIKSFVMKDSILATEWSPDAKYLYAGGEDFNVSAINTEFWEVIHQVHRNRWVQCISSSNSGSHLAVGGVSSEISILDVDKGWDSVMGIELKGLVPLSAKWHPKDQYLTVTGQNNSVLAVETTNARHVAGHHLHSISPILSIEFSPDGRMAIIGNKSGVVTFFSLAGSTFVTAYELVVVLNDKLSIHWSLNGLFTVIGSNDALIIVRRKVPPKDAAKGSLPSASGFSVRKVIRELGIIRGVSIDPHSQYVAVSGSHTQILDAHAGFAKVQEFKDGPCLANAWSPDGRWLATIGKEKVLTIYDTGHERLDRWRSIFSLKCDFVGHALAWGPLIVGGLLYLAYGGDGNEITIMEIRTLEGTWETVLRVPRDGAINALDWNTDGLLAAAIGNGTVCIVDLAYLQSGVAVNEMDYDWQRQALTCFTEIRRNRGKNSMCSVRWIPSAPGSDNLLAVGGTDGELEIIDLTERRRCRGYVRGLKS
jgi:hypothetical protein